MIIKSKLQTDAPRENANNYRNVFGGRDSDTCTTMSVSASDMPNGQIKVDSYTGALTWNIELKRLDPTSSIRLKKILVETSNNDIGMITVIPLTLQNNGQLVQLNSISSQVNSPITDFRMYYNMNIYTCLVTMFPISSGSVINQNQVSITIDYCSLIGNQSRVPKFTLINPDLSRNNMNSKDDTVNQQPHIILTSSYQQPNVVQTYNVPSPARVIPYISGPINGVTQTNPVSTASCNQPQSLAMHSTSHSVVVQDNIWQINIDQIYGLPVIVNSLRVNTQGQLVSGTVLLTFIDANQKQIGPYVFQMNTGSLLTFQNLPSIPISSVQLQFPDGTQSSSYLLDMVICSQTNVAPPAINSLENQPWVAPAPLPAQKVPNSPSITISDIAPQSQSQQVPRELNEINMTKCYLNLFHSIEHNALTILLANRYALYASQSGQPLQQELSWQPLQPTKFIQQSQPLQPSQSGQLSQQSQLSPAAQPSQANPQILSWQLQQPGPVNIQIQPLPSSPFQQVNQQSQPSLQSRPERVNLQGQPLQPPQSGQLSQQSQPSPATLPGQANPQVPSWQLQQSGPVNAQSQPLPSSSSQQVNQQSQPSLQPQPERVNLQNQPLPTPQLWQANLPGQSWPLPQSGPAYSQGPHSASSPSEQTNQQHQSLSPEQSEPVNQQRQPLQSPPSMPDNQKGQPWQLPRFAPISQQGGPSSLPQSDQINQQIQSWQLPQFAPVNQQGQRWQPSYPSQVSQQGQPGQGQTNQPDEAAKPGRFMGFYTGPNGRGPLPIPGLYIQDSNNQNIYDQKPDFGTNNYNPAGQYPNNQYGPFMPPLTTQNIDDEIPCSLYLVRPGSRRIVSNITDGARITLLLQVPSKAGYISVPNFISILKTSLTQLSVNYVNANQTSASMSNGSALQFVAAPNASDIGAFPEHVPAQMLQVNIDGAPAPLPPPSLEVHMIICYEPISQVQLQQSTSSFQQSSTLSNAQQTPKPQQPFISSSEPKPLISNVSIS
ncbi:unnamed protein product [Rotaria sp. Silwood2]|nr:unnamed protein product [Rotaria sp. Silwood2]